MLLILEKLNHCLRRGVRLLTRFTYILSLYLSVLLLLPFIYLRTAFRTLKSLWSIFPAQRNVGSGTIMIKGVTLGRTDSPDKWGIKHLMEILSQMSMRITNIEGKLIQLEDTMSATKADLDAGIEKLKSSLIVLDTTLNSLFARFLELLKNQAIDLQAELDSVNTVTAKTDELVQTAAAVMNAKPEQPT